jgi:hypothetical protein
MELNEIKYKYIVDLTKFFIEKYKSGEIKNFEMVRRNVIALAPFILDFGITFDETIWLPDDPNLYNNLIEFRVQLKGTIGYFPFRLFLKEGINQTPVYIDGNTMMWNTPKIRSIIFNKTDECGEAGGCENCVYRTCPIKDKL